MPIDTTFSSPSVGGLILFADNGQFEIWRIDRDFNFLFPQPSASGDLGSDLSLVGLANGRRYTAILSQRDNGELSLHRLVSGTVHPTPTMVGTQKDLSTRQKQGGWKARSFSLYLPNPKFCLEGESEYLIFMERPQGSSLLDEVWTVGEDGRIKVRRTFDRQEFEQFADGQLEINGWDPVAVGIGAVDSPHPWILFKRPDGLEAKLVQTQRSASDNELNPTSNVVPFTTLGTPLTGLPAASGFAFASTVRDNERSPGSYHYWLHVYKWPPSSSDGSHDAVIKQVPGDSSYPPDRHLHDLTGRSPAGLELMAYADLRPACMSWKSMPKPDERLWGAEVRGTLTTSRDKERHSRIWILKGKINQQRSLNKASLTTLPLLIEHLENKA